MAYSSVLQSFNVNDGSITCFRWQEGRARQSSVSESRIKKKAGLGDDPYPCGIMRRLRLVLIKSNLLFQLGYSSSNN